MYSAAPGELPRWSRSWRRAPNRWWSPWQIVSLFATGLSPPLVQVYCWDIQRRAWTPELLYSGPAPGLLPAVTQVNVRVPRELLGDCTLFLGQGTTRRTQLGVHLLVPWTDGYLEAFAALWNAAIVTFDRGFMTRGRVPVVLLG